MDMITIGESLVVFDSMSLGPLRHVNDFKKRMAGAESNVSIGMSRLGHNVGWLSRVGDDEFGRYILGSLRSEGVDISQVIVDHNRSTGVMFKEKRNANLTNISYYRSNSAASMINEKDIEESWIKKSKLLHITGITPALSKTCHEAIIKAVRIAKEANIPVSFDANLRLKLWGENEARQTILSLIPDCTYFLPGFFEGKLLTGIESIEDMAAYFYNMGPEVVVIKDGKNGAYLYDSSGGYWIESFRVDKVIDSVGAGDAFAAGFLSGVLNGKSNKESVKQANLLGAYAVSVSGDWEGLPIKSELNQLFMEEDTNR